MRILLLSFILLLGSMTSTAYGESRYFEVEVAEPYIELHTGPGRGYPVFHVADRGAQLTVIKRRTDWFKVRTDKGKEGWVTRAQMELTLTRAGEPAQFAEPQIGDFTRRRWEGGLLGGDFEGANIMTVYAAYTMTPNLSAEVSVSQAFRNSSSIILAGISLVAQPFPEWRLAPFFSLGTGAIHTDPNITRGAKDDHIEQIGSVGAGLRWYLNRRFILRAEYRNHVIFQNTDDNQEIDEWKAGLAFFF